MANSPQVLNQLNVGQTPLIFRLYDDLEELTGNEEKSNSSVLQSLSRNNTPKKVRTKAKERQCKSNMKQNLLFDDTPNEIITLNNAIKEKDSEIERLRAELEEMCQINYGNKENQSTSRKESTGRYNLRQRVETSSQNNSRKKLQKNVSHTFSQEKSQSGSEDKIGDESFNQRLQKYKAELKNGEFVSDYEKLYTTLRKARDLIESNGTKLWKVENELELCKESLADMTSIALKKMDQLDYVIGEYEKLNSRFIKQSNVLEEIRHELLRSNLSMINK